MNVSVFENRNVLVVSPHTDDGELGAGGLIAKLLKANANVYFLTFCIAEDSVPDGFPKDILAKEAVMSAASFGVDKSRVDIHRYPVRRLQEHRQSILDILIGKKKERQFDLVLCPNTTDFHQDHEVVSREVIRAFKNTTILGYDLPWNNLTELQSCFIEICENDIQAKLDALNCYKSQSFRKYTSKNFIQSLAMLRGSCVGKDYAERFEVIRMVME